MIKKQYELSKRLAAGVLLLCASVSASASILILAPEKSFLPAAHVALAIVTSLLFVAAFGLAVLLWFQARRLHGLPLNDVRASWLDKLPPVLSLERTLFRVVGVGFILLSVLMLSGMFFGEMVWGKSLVFSHKVLLTILAWLLFAALLLGRVVAGWRGLTAVRATIFGFALLFLAYAGTHFVLDVVLKR